MIVGVSGFARSGKDTVGAHLERRYGFRRHRYAAILKEVCARVFGWGPEHIDGDLKETPDPRHPFSGDCVRCGTRCIRNEPRVDGPPLWLCPACTWGYDHDFVTPRLAFQTCGTEWARRLTTDVWVEATLREIREGERVVLCDVRFPNEAIAIRRRGGRVIRLTRGRPESAHASELALEGRPDCFDAAIDNEGTLEDLFAAVDRAMDWWGIAPEGE